MIFNLTLNHNFELQCSMSFNNPSKDTLINFKGMSDLVYICIICFWVVLWTLISNKPMFNKDFTVLINPSTIWKWFNETNTQNNELGCTYPLVIVWQLELFRVFKLKNLSFPMMLRVFEGLKPWFVKRLKEWNTRTCRYHTKLNELKLGLSSMRATRKEVHSGCNCSCETICKHELNVVLGKLYCTIYLQVYKTMTFLWSLILCAKDETVEFHKKRCIMGDYLRCMIESLNICPHELTTERHT